MTTPSSSRSLRPLAAPVAASALYRSEWSNPHFRRLLVLQMAFGYCFSALLLVPKYADTWLGANAAQIGQLQASPVIIGILAAPLCGRWLDRGAWRQAIITGALLIAASTMAFGAIHRLDAAAYLLRGLQGLGNTLLLGGTGALITRIVAREHHARAFGTVGAAALMMNAAASSATEWLAETRGWGMAFEVAGFCALLALGISATMPALAPTPATTTAAPLATSAWPLRRAVDTGAAAAGAGFATIATFTQPFALSLGANRVATLFVGYTVTALFVRIAFGGVADRVGRRRAATVALAIYALAALLASQLRPGWLFELGLVFGLAHGIAWPALCALAVEHAPAERIGSALARVQALFGVGSLLAVWGGGFLVERVGYPLTFVITSATVSAGAFVLGSAGAPRRSAG